MTDKEKEPSKVVDMKGQPVDEKEKDMELEAMELSDEALVRARGQDLVSALVIGRTKDGRLYIDNSQEYVPTLVHMMELAKLKVMGF